MVRSEAIRHQDMPEMHRSHKQIDMAAQEQIPKMIRLRASMPLVAGHQHSDNGWL